MLGSDVMRNVYVDRDSSKKCEMSPLSLVSLFLHVYETSWIENPSKSTE